MNVVWGLVVLLVSLVCWGGQLVSWRTPDAAVKLGLMEAEGEVEPTY